MKHIKIKAKFTVSDEFFESDTFQDVKKSILAGEMAKEWEIEGDVWDMEVSFIQIKNG